MKKPKLEADLDPPNTRRTRPGGTAAARVVAAQKAGGPTRGNVAPAKTTTTSRSRGLRGLEADLDPQGTTRTRPGGFAAGRAIAASRPRGKKR